MKQWLLVFSAALVAGLVVFGVWRSDQKADQAAAAWNPRAKQYAADLEYTAAAFETGNAVARGPESEVSSLRWQLKSAEHLLATAPTRGDKSRLERAIARAKETLLKS